jgi:hypothetical protein
MSVPFLAAHAPHVEAARSLYQTRHRQPCSYAVAVRHTSGMGTAVVVVWVAIVVVGLALSARRRRRTPTKRAR